MTLSLGLCTRVTMIATRTKRTGIGLIVILALLSGCGQMPDPTPVPPAATTAPPDAATATVSSPVAGELTLGDLAQRVGAAWPAVRSYRVTFTGATVPLPAASGTPVSRPAATPGATPVARSAETFATVRDVVLPDRQYQRVSGLGADDHEAVAIGDALFVRGPLVDRIAPGTPPETWITIDPATLPAGATLTRLLGGLPAIPAAPLASLPERLWPQAVRELGVESFDGRECRVYGAADTVTERRGCVSTTPSPSTIAISPASSRPAPAESSRAATNTPSSTATSPSRRRPPPPRSTSPPPWPRRPLTTKSAFQNPCWRALQQMRAQPRVRKA